MDHIQLYKRESIRPPSYIQQVIHKQYTKAHSGCSPSLLHNHLCIRLNHGLKLLSGLLVRSLKDITVDNPRMANRTALNLILVATQAPEVDRSLSIGLVVTLGLENVSHSKSSERLAVSHDLTGVSRSRSLSSLSLLSHIPQRLSSKKSKKSEIIWLSQQCLHQPSNRTTHHTLHSE